MNIVRSEKLNWGYVFCKQIAKEYIMSIDRYKNEINVYNEKEMVTETKIKLKGAVMNIGVESYFNDIVACKKVPISELEKYQNDLLHITEDDRDLGYKHVIQTRLTKETRNERIRSNPDTWSKNETYIDGNIKLVLDRLNSYYGD